MEIGDSTYEFSDPKGIQAEKLITLETLSPIEKVKAMLGQDADAFLSEPTVDGYVLDAVLTKYMKHYGMGTVPEELASLRSLNGTARPSKRTAQRKGSH